MRRYCVNNMSPETCAQHKDAEDTAHNENKLLRSKRNYISGHFLCSIVIVFLYVIYYNQIENKVKFPDNFYV